jgi:hypothetical protein
MPAPRTIFHNTAREDGDVDDFDEGTWRYFTFDEQSLAALHRRLQEETKHKDFVVCRRSCGPAPRLFPVVLDLPPGNNEMEFVLVLVPSKGTAAGYCNRSSLAFLGRCQTLLFGF